MGDAFELVCQLDYAFAVELSQKEAEQKQTAGQLADWLLPILRERMKPDAATPDIFAVTLERVTHILRQATPQLASVKRTTELEKALPRNAQERSLVWSQLSIAPFPIPQLESASLLETTTGILLYSLPFGILTGIMKASQNLYWLVLAIFVLLLFILPPLFRRARTLQTRPPISTVGELVDYLVLHNYWHLAMERDSWSEGEAWRVLQKIVAREADIEPDEVRRDNECSELLIWD